jgi:hypothetical protein
MRPTRGIIIWQWQCLLGNVVGASHRRDRGIICTASKQQQGKVTVWYLYMMSSICHLWWDASNQTPTRQQSATVRFVQYQYDSKVGYHDIVHFRRICYLSSFRMMASASMFEQSHAKYPSG